MRTRTYGLDRDTLTYAQRIKSGSGTVLSNTALKQINKFVVGVKRMGLWNSMVCWPMRSIYNAGTGSTVYSLGGLGIYNGTINNSMPWSRIGIGTRTNTFNVSFNTLTYSPNSFVGTFCFVGGYHSVANQRSIGHNINAGGWAISSVSNNNGFSYFDTSVNTRGYSTMAMNNRDFLFFLGLSRYSNGDNNIYATNPNTTNDYYRLDNTQKLLGITSATSYSYVAAGINSFFMHVAQRNFTQSDYLAVYTLLWKTLFNDNIIKTT